MTGQRCSGSRRVGSPSLYVLSPSQPHLLSEANPADWARTVPAQSKETESWERSHSLPTAEGPALRLPLIPYPETTAPKFLENMGYPHPSPPDVLLSKH